MVQLYNCYIHETNLEEVVQYDPENLTMSIACDFFFNFKAN